MSQTEWNDKTERLCDKAPIEEDVILNMSEKEVEYYHWLYFEESVYDLM